MDAATTLDQVEKLMNDFIFVLFYAGIEIDLNNSRPLTFKPSISRNLVGNTSNIPKIKKLSLLFR
jgi:hypothetical protein